MTASRSDNTAAVRLGEAIRKLMDVSVLTLAGDDALLAAGSAVHAITDSLSGSLRETMPWPDDESMRRGERPFSPVIGTANPLAPPMIVQVLDDSSVMAELTMRPIHEGPPEALHGGWVAMLLDQLLGHANAAAGVGGFTASLTVNYRRPTPLGVPIVVRARTDSVEGRKVYTTGEITADGVVTADAKGLFVQPSPRSIDKLRSSTEGRVVPIE